MSNKNSENLGDKNFPNLEVETEREFKYIADENVTLESIIEFFVGNGGVTMSPSNTTYKYETYYDDENFTIAKRGDVLRQTKAEFPTGTAEFFLYKRNISDKDSNFVKKTELKIETVDLAIVEKILDGHIPSEVKPVLNAKMTRNRALVEFDGVEFELVIDRTEYSVEDGETATDVMVEMEVNPQIGADIDISTIHNVIVKFPNLVATKVSKYERGCELLEIFKVQ